MLAGELYLACDPELRADRLRTRKILKQLNEMEPDDPQKTKLLIRLFGSIGENADLEIPFRCDYGYNIHLGDRVMMNFGCVFLDVCEIRIGDDTLLAPNVHLYAATHPLDWRIRKNGGPESGKPITIGSDCWLGGGVIVCPGVRIGDRCVIGAGSVVTKDIPPDSLAVGNPARVVKSTCVNP